MSNNNAPDSWESQADSNSANSSPSHNADVTAKFSTLNVNAVEFVPSFAIPPVAVEQSSPTKSEDASLSPEHSPILNGAFFPRNFDSSCRRFRLYSPFRRHSGLHVLTGFFGFAINAVYRISRLPLQPTAHLICFILCVYFIFGVNGTYTYFTEFVCF